MTGIALALFVIAFQLLIFVVLSFLLIKLDRLGKEIADLNQTLAKIQMEAYEERKDLYNRLMSKDLADYSFNKEKTHKERMSNSTGNFLRDAQIRAVQTMSYDNEVGE